MSSVVLMDCMPPRVAILTEGWQSRLVRISNANTAGTTGLCLEVHDLAISKYAAGRHKDLEFTRELARHALTDPRALLDRLAKTQVSAAVRKLIGGQIKSDARARKL